MPFQLPEVFSAVPVLCPKCGKAANWDLCPKPVKSVRGALWQCTGCGHRIAVLPDEASAKVAPPVTDLERIHASLLAGGSTRIAFVGRVVLHFEGWHSLTAVLVDGGVVVVDLEVCGGDVDLAKPVRVEGIVAPRPVRIFGTAGWSWHALIVKAHITQAIDVEEKHD